ncbi:hypothetical protein FLJC2902T_19330 [Flavobacterium limnosediminis JC2902]|uniref:Uncharacterized protein n=1 Tax=Flavobacterium limnosediminis JC2902 TaxID=1341181 RepID=V6SMF4_9FLAO|nr:hypothetical protein FLJC2902T_19330 [Flavobacterium limnosediminis JC2902]
MKIIEKNHFDYSCRVPFHSESFKAGSIALMGVVSFCGALAEQKIKRTAGTRISNNHQAIRSQNP